MNDKEKKPERQVVLAVDDMGLSLRTMKIALETKFDVRLVKSAQHALAIIKSERIDLVLLDIEMPEMSGFDFMLKLKDSAAEKKPPVIFVTAYATPELLARAKVAGAVSYVVKPFSPEVLLKKVNDALGLSSAAQQ